MVPGFVRQGLLQQVPNFKLALAKVFSKLGRGRYIKQCIALFFYLVTKWSIILSLDLLQKEDSNVEKSKGFHIG